MLVGYWKLDGNTLDSSDYGNNGNSVSVNYGTGKINQCYSNPSGENRYVSVPNSPSLQITKDYTVAMWVYPTSNADRRNPINKAYGGEGTITHETNGTLNFFWGTTGVNSSPYQSVNSNKVLPLNQWSHIAVVRKIGHYVRWYINGVITQEVSPSYSSAVASSYDFTIGSGYTTPYEGSIDEVRLYNHALGQKDIQLLMSESTLSKFAEDQINKQCEMFFKFNRPSNFIVEDLSGNHRNAYIYTAIEPTWSSDSPPENTGSYYFNSGDRIDLPSMGAWTATQGTWCAKVKRNSSLNSYNMFLGNHKPYHCFRDTDQFFFSADINGTQRSVITTDTYSDGVWYDYVATYDGQYMRIYIDGVEKGSGYYPGSIDFGNSSYGAAIGDGSNSSYYPYNGYVSEVKIFTRSLSASEVAEMYNSRKKAASIDKSKIFWVRDNDRSTHLKANDKNILDYTTWQIGTSGSQPGFSSNGPTNENYIIASSDMKGKTVPVWEARPNSVSDADGGWGTTTFSVDPGRMYRYTIWIKRSVLGNGSTYFGMYGYYPSSQGVYPHNSTTINANPYFWYGGWNWGNNWTLLVGHVHPWYYGTSSIQPDSGIYSYNGTKISSISFDFRWHQSTTTAVHRTYLYYSTNTSTRQQFLYPRVDLIDGTEPSIDDLIRGFDSDYYDYYSNALPLPAQSLSKEGIYKGYVNSDSSFKISNKNIIADDLKIIT